MDEPTATAKRLWLLAKLAIAVSLAGAVWSVAGGEACAECQDANALLGDLPLGWAGVVFYTALLALMWVKGPRPLAILGAQAAAAAHFVLLGLLLHHQIACAPCIVTGAGAIVAAALCLSAHPRLFRRAYGFMPAVALVVFAGVTAIRVTLVEAKRAEAAREAVRMVAARAGVPAGRAKLIVFSRPRCPACVALKEEVLPALTREFKERLLIEEVAAPRGLATPTLFVIGAIQEQITGVPTPEALRMVVLDALAPPAEE